MKVGDRVTCRDTGDNEAGVIVARTVCEDGVDCLVAFVDPHIECPNCHDVYVLRYLESSLELVKEENLDGY